MFPEEVQGGRFGTPHPIHEVGSFSSLLKCPSLNEKFPNSGIGQDDPIQILQLWHSFGNIVYSKKIADISHLKRGIIAAMETITSEMLHKIWRGTIILI
ncbi:hypothetical protein AVEN_196328-1 [Araneus ventricosus]|uniref:Uncharacterized protein n=1 Tax=Araneus ventricosus TaxID=182803 RepID=A0A4Y2AUR9_ARAVE|nr:hypothetical protein AVEN_196328-1 [Araneus ventricosus]